MKTLRIKITTSLFAAIIMLCSSCNMKYGKIFSENTSKINIKSGKKFSIELASNRSTGYRWQLANMPDGTTLQLISSKYIASKQAKEKVGAGGKEIFTFKSSKKGNTKLSFIYVRGGDVSNAAKQANIDVEVK